MRIVCQHGFARQAALGRHNPGVAALPTLERAHPLPERLHEVEQQPSRVQQALVRHAVGLEDGRRALWHARLQFGCAIGVALQQQAQPHQLALPIRALTPRYHLEVRQAVKRRPRCNPRAQQAELGCEAAWAACDVRVHPFGVPCQRRPRHLIEAIQLKLGGAAETHRAAEAVGVECRLTKEFGERARGNASILLHLPHAVLGMDNTLRAEEVRPALGIEVRHTMFVTQDFDRRVQPCECERTAQPRLGARDPPPVQVAKENSGRDKRAADKYGQNECDCGADAHASCRIGRRQMPAAPFYTRSHPVR